MRTIAEIESEIEEWKHRQFMNQMNDHWSRDDYKFDTECTEKIDELKKELAEVKAV